MLKAAKGQKVKGGTVADRCELPDSGNWVCQTHEEAFPDVDGRARHESHYSDRGRPCVYFWQCAYHGPETV